MKSRLIRATRLLAAGRAALLAGFIATGLWGCASEPPPPSTPSTKEIRGNSDRYFEKMKQEERERGQGTERHP
jgi:hypothetical protein